MIALCDNQDFLRRVCDAFGVNGRLEYNVQHKKYHSEFDCQPQQEEYIRSYIRGYEEGRVA